MELSQHDLLSSDKQMSLDFDYWSDDDILLMMDAVLTTSLESLRDGRASGEIVQETMEWVMSDEIKPFSFSVCCRALGYDHEELRDALLATLSSRGKFPH